MMKTADLRRRLQEALRHGDLSLVAPDLIRCVGIATDNDEIATRLSAKLFHRHRNRPGRRRDPERDGRLADAVIWARFNRGALKRTQAIEQAAQRYQLPENVVARAYDGKNEKITALIRRINGQSATPDSLGSAPDSVGGRNVPSTEAS